MKKISKIAVLSSGGDAPGMNAAIRSVVRAAIFHGLEVEGIEHGYEGMIKAEFVKLKSKNVRNIIQRGGTILRTARSEEFKTEEGRQKAYDNLVKRKIDAVIVIGGDGTFRGAGIFSQEFDIPFVGIPGTIDNDMFGTDFTIGFDTALNTVVEAIDRIKDTASSHDRMFFIEVMGRDAGFIALQAGIATGAEAILIPEIEGQAEKLKEYLLNESKSKKSSSIILVAEGNNLGGAVEVANKVKDDFKDFNVRVNVLGHMQRGGTPTAFDRFLASRLGVAAVDALLDNQRSVMVGYKNHEVVHVPFNKTIKGNRDISNELLRVADILTI
ncbi:MAG: 6-phosphofructokinase [Bacteroidales bacterium]|nr:6-phosphofructokinase [Bacteroidales bacterium]MBN2757596.1 6-phosphofructokinase [Bacteroidales bacterium]